MTPDDFNARELAAGRITASHITALTRLYQASRLGMSVDGKLGPRTRNAALLAEVGLQLRQPATAQGAKGAVAAILAARRDAITWASTDGLSPVQVAELRKGMVRGMWADEPPRTNWCAAAVSSWIDVAGVPVPRKGAPRRGAQALTRWVAEYGSWALSPQSAGLAALPDSRCWELLKPGDVICWRRPPLGWRGHVALILRVLASDEVHRSFNGSFYEATHYGAGSIEIAEGNVDGGHLVIRTLKADEWPPRISGLYGVARPNYGGAR